MSGIEEWPQSDGALWYVLPYRDGELVLTGKGQELLEDHPEVVDYFSAYERLMLGATALEGVVELETRTFLASGARSSVYEMAPGVVVKEAIKEGSPVGVLQRMDRFFNIIETDVPRWIDMPHQYGVLVARSMPKDLIFQQKIDSGITVEWILRPEECADYQLEALRREFGEVPESEQELIQQAFTAAGRILAEAINRNGDDPRSYLTDFHEGNMLIERLRTPVAGHRHKLWIIDQ